MVFLFCEKPCIVGGDDRTGRFNYQGIVRKAIGKVRWLFHVQNRTSMEVRPEKWAAIKGRKGACRN
jgi:hypothetical protein